MESQNEGMSIDEFKKKFDNRTKLREAVQMLERGRLLREKEFINKIKLIGGYKDLVEDIEFEPFRGKVNNENVFWSHPDTIKDMKEANPPLLK
jgi:hypothetical protein